MKYFLFILWVLISVLSSKSQTYCVYIQLTSTNFAYIDENGKILYSEDIDPLVNERIFPLKNGLGRIRRKGKFGYINHLGQVVIPIIYDSAKDFEGGIAEVKIDNKWGYINTKGELEIRPQFETVNRFCENLAAFSLNGRHGFINNEGKIVIIPMFDLVSNFFNNRAWVLVGDKWGAINKTGAFVFPLDYEAVCDFSEGYAWVKVGPHWGLIDSLNKYIIPLSERNNLVYGLSNKTNDFAQVSNGLLISKANNKVGYCSLPSLKKTIASKFDEGSEFEQGTAIVSIENKKGIIDTSGDYLSNLPYKEIKRIGDKNIFAVKQEDKEWGLLDVTSNTFFPLPCKNIFYIEKIK
ncbi:MAG: WG repeat-containing protein [Bacteroidia bacterium]|nr:WG repeat-containing protein [Bacteroidia bacterium]